MHSEHSGEENALHTDRNHTSSFSTEKVEENQELTEMALGNQLEPQKDPSQSSFQEKDQKHFDSAMIPIKPPKNSQVTPDLIRSLSKQLVERMISHVSENFQPLQSLNQSISLDSKEHAQETRGEASAASCLLDQEKTEEMKTDGASGAEKTFGLDSGRVLFPDGDLRQVDDLCKEKVSQHVSLDVNAPNIASGSKDIDSALLNRPAVLYGSTGFADEDVQVLEVETNPSESQPIPSPPRLRKRQSKHSDSEVPAKKPKPHNFVSSVDQAPSDQEKSKTEQDSAQNKVRIVSQPGMATRIYVNLTKFRQVDCNAFAVDFERFSPGLVDVEDGKDNDDTQMQVENEDREVSYSLGSAAHGDYYDTDDSFIDDADVVWHSFPPSF
jgi:hypothetical protein